MLVRTGARAPASGVLVGLAVGVVLSIVASKVVPGVRAVDPVALVVVALAVGTLVLAALAFPTRALLRADPMRRLRDE
jgi:ABC-type antimicrobial peptide transport system permease subunit